MASHLVRAQITDKNGVTKTHWVKNVSIGSNSASLPGPSSAPSPDAEATRLDAEIRKTVSAATQAGPNRRWTIDDKTHLRMLVMECDVDSLRVIQRLVSKDAECSPEEIGKIARELRRHGQDHPAELMHDDALAARRDILMALKAYGDTVSHPYYNQKHEAKDVWCMAFTDFDDAPSIIDIVSERGIIPQDEIREIIADREDISAPLRRGAL